MVFDVSMGFLSSMAMSREVYAKAPCKGLAAVGDCVVPPHAFCGFWRDSTVAKKLRGCGISGRTKCWRTWVSRSVGAHVQRSSTGSSIWYAWLIQHVGDGMLLGDTKFEKFNSIREA